MHCLNIIGAQGSRRYVIFYTQFMLSFAQRNDARCLAHINACRFKAINLKLCSTRINLTVATTNSKTIYFIQDYVPLKSIKGNTDCKPWFGKQCGDAGREKNKYFQKWHFSRQECDWIAFTKLRNSYKKIISQAKKSFRQTLSVKIKPNSLLRWR